ncbi:hypothetical protein [Methylobacterium sp. ID0610]|uniref:hypothetical protein n=1 Tax=Methylobacterium carpenticola TaxID=3344827 RepID=UPI0036BBBD52
MTTTKIYIAAIEDSEGCGSIETSVHLSLAGATKALRRMVHDEYGICARKLGRMNAEQICELIDEDGHSAHVTEQELLP